MKLVGIGRVFGFAAALTFNAGCDQAEPRVAPSPAATSLESVAGTYEATLPNGKTVRHTLDEDGSYSEQDGEGNPVEAGTWRLDGDEICYDPQGSEPEACYTSGPSEEVVKLRDPVEAGQSTQSE